MAQTIHLKANGGPAIARITIGQAQVGKFAISIFDANKQNPQKIGSGVTPPSTQDATMGAAPALNGKFLAWVAVIIPFTENNEPYALTMDVLQDDVRVASFTESGTFNGGTPKKVPGSAVIAIT